MKVHFRNREDAQVAKDSLNGTVLGSKTLYIEWNQMQFRGCQGGYRNNNMRMCLPNGFSTNFDVGPVISIYVQFETVEVLL